MEDLNCNLDLDDLFAHRTPKVVIVKDRYLGMLHYIFMGGIFGYIIIYVIILSKGYLEEDIPIVATRMTLREPSAGGLSRSLNMCKYNANRTDILEMDYCAQNPSSPSPIQCEYADWQAVVCPADQPDSMFITTSNTRTIQESRCDPRTDPCYYEFATISREETYIANIENFTIGVFHSVRANAFYSEMVADGKWDFNGNPYKQSDIAASNYVMKGNLRDVTGKEICNFGGATVDVIPVKIMLDGAKVGDLDDTSTVDEKKTIRSEGLVITLSIDYSNRNSKNYTISYTYRPAILPQISYKVEEPILLYNDNGQVQGRIINNRHGVKLIVLPTGVIYRFSFQALLVQIVSGMALIATAATLVDIMALKVMPMRSYYQKAKLQYTDDFSKTREQIQSSEGKYEVFRSNPAMAKYTSMS